MRALVQTWAPYRTALVFASLAADLARVLHAMIPIAPLKIHHRAHHRTRNTGCQAVRADVFRLSSLIWELRQLPSLLALSASMPASFACCAASIILRPLFGIGLSGIREAITINSQLSAVVHALTLVLQCVQSKIAVLARVAG